ncbi:MAG: hypothetical protein Q9161_001266 [Pseudevernia consocians]
MRSPCQILYSGRSIGVRPKVTGFSAHRIPLCLRPQQKRNITADERPLPESEQPKGPNQDQLPHVSEEAAATGKITGEAGPELEQGSPVQEVLKRDEKSQEKAPKVLQEELRASSPKGSRSYSTSAPRRAQAMIKPESAEVQNQGHIFGLPELPLPSTSHLKRRYDPIVHQVTNLLMQDGKLSKAQRDMAMILERLRTAAPPTPDPRHPLIPGAPPTNHLPLNPILYLTFAIDSVAPLLRIRAQKGAAGGGVALQIPIPLGLRQRRRAAVMWILDVATKRRTKGSGRTMFAHKIADELIAIVEGRSGVWDRRAGVHRLGVAARANLTFGNRRR